MAADEIVRARIEAQVKNDATQVLQDMGLTVSDAIRLMLMRVAAEKALPFDVKVPNAQTREAVAELEDGRGKRFDSPATLLQDLNAPD